MNKRPGEAVPNATVLEKLARAANAEPWDPPPGMIKRRCPTVSLLVCVGGRDGPLSRLRREAAARAQAASLTGRNPNYRREASDAARETYWGTMAGSASRRVALSREMPASSIAFASASRSLLGPWPARAERPASLPKWGRAAINADPASAIDLVGLA